MLRWDSLKERAFLAVSGPVGSSASARYSIDSDARREQWDVQGQSRLLKKFETTLALSSLSGARGSWSSGVIIGAPGFGYTGDLGYDLIRWPDRRLTVNTNVRLKAKRIAETAYARAEGRGTLKWLPQARGNDFATSLTVSAGSATGETPFDELFALGIDRDSELNLRAHPAVRNGKKGAAVLASRYALLNAETEKTVHDFAIIRLGLAPFLDV